MPQAEESQNGHSQIPFSLTALEGKRVHPMTEAARPNFSVAERAYRRYEVNLSGAQVLLGSAAMLGSVVSFLWVLVKLWLFGR